MGSDLVTMPYQDALDFLFPRTTQIKFGLDTTRALLDVLGNPQRQYATIHVAGTNGKGSTASLIAEALGAKVAIEAKPGGKGRIVIAYSSLDELDGIVAKLKGAP